MPLNAVTKRPRVIFLESQEGIESLFTRGLRSGAVAAGWEASVVFLAEEDGEPRTEKDVRIDLLEAKPDAICFLMDGPLHLKNIWDAPSLSAVDKISLWFDDYYRSPKTLAHPETWADWQKNHHVRVGIWDGYWRCQWKRLTGCDAFPIHLAADPRLLRPTEKIWNPEWKDRATFVGTVPAIASLETCVEAFPAFMRRFLDEICQEMKVSPWPIKPYEIAQKCRSFAGVKYGNAIDAMLKDPAPLALWNHLLWRWGKRIARLRGLTAVAQAGPLAILSGHGTESYAGEEELRAALPARTDLVYADTRDVSASQWKSLFRTGKFQVQITDPQSISGGLPFRVFECAACAVPLLSDHRPELSELFPVESGLLTATDEKALYATAGLLFQTPKRDLDSRGRLLNDEFLRKHTWELRWLQLMQGRSGRDEDAVHVPRPQKAVRPAVRLEQQPA